MNPEVLPVRLRWLAAALFLGLALAYPGREAGGKIYIDIVSSPRKLPIAIQGFAGPSGKEISDIISGDLEFSGLFLPLESESFIESPWEPFDPMNWRGTGVEAVIKGTVSSDDFLHVTARLYDVFEGKSILEKKYRAEPSLLRPLAHTIANDIYREITGHESAFRTRMAFVMENDGVHELALSDWDGMRTLRPGVKASTLLTPHWSGDGSRLLYSAQRMRKWSVYLLDFEEKKERIVFSVPGVNISGDFFPGDEAFALSSSKDGSSDLYVFHLKGQRLRKLTQEPGIEVSPAVSADGMRLAYVSDSGGSPQIYTIDKFGYNKTRVTFEGTYNTSPVWSPRGDRIAFSGRYNGRNQIFTIRPDGSDLQRLTDAGNNEEPSFSPDGRFIAFTSDRGGKKGVYIMRANGESQTRISPPGVKAFNPRWSPK